CCTCSGSTTAGSATATRASTSASPASSTPRSSRSCSRKLNPSPMSGVRGHRGRIRETTSGTRSLRPVELDADALVDAQLVLRVGLQADDHLPRADVVELHRLQEHRPALRVPLRDADHLAVPLPLAGDVVEDLRLLADVQPLGELLLDLGP